MTRMQHQTPEMIKISMSDTVKTKNMSYAHLALPDI